MFEFWIDALSILVSVQGGRVMMSFVFQGLFFFFVLLILAAPLGFYIKMIMTGETPRFVRFIQPIERGFYRLIGSESQRKVI